MGALCRALGITGEAKQPPLLQSGEEVGGSR